MKNKFNFYEVVEIAKNDEPKLRALVGMRGSVLGMSQHEETNRWVYSISLEATDESWSIAEEHLVATGESRERSDFYSGESVKVRVCPKTNEGSLG